MTQQNTALVEQASAAAQEMHDQAAALAQVVGVFKLDTAQPGRADRPSTPPRPLRLQGRQPGAGAAR